MPAADLEFLGKLRGADRLRLLQNPNTDLPLSCAYHLQCFFDPDGSLIFRLFRSFWTRKVVVFQIVHRLDAGCQFDAVGFKDDPKERDELARFFLLPRSDKGLEGGNYRFLEKVVAVSRHMPDVRRGNLSDQLAVGGDPLQGHFPCLSVVCLLTVFGLRCHFSPELFPSSFFYD